MAINFTNDKPIFQQIVEIITLDIINGKYKPGDKLDAVRELAVSVGVNPNTMQRALTEIENSGIIYAKRGDGRYVTENIEVINKVRNEYVSKNVRSFISSLKALGLDEQAILSSVNQELNI